MVVVLLLSDLSQDGESMGQLHADSCRLHVGLLSSRVVCTAVVSLSHEHSHVRGPSGPLWRISAHRWGLGDAGIESRFYSTSVPTKVRLGDTLVCCWWPRGRGQPLLWTGCQSPETRKQCLPMEGVPLVSTGTSEGTFVLGIPVQLEKNG